MIVVVGTLTGGAAVQTTSAVFLAFGLAADGSRALLVDAGQTNKNISGDHSGAGEDWPERIAVVRHGGHSLARDISGLAAGFDNVVIEVGRADEMLLSAALSIADELVCPALPSLAELRRLPPTFQLADAMGIDRDLRARVLLVGTERGSGERREAIRVLAEENLPAFATHVRSVATGIPARSDGVTGLLDYGPVLDELLGHPEGAHRKHLSGVDAAGSAAGAAQA